MNILSKRIPTLFGLLIIVALVFAYFFIYGGSSKQVNADLTPQKIKITNIADNKFSVSWVTKTATVGQIVYAPVGQKLDKTGNDVRGAGKFFTHHVTVESLQPNTQYAFRVVSGDKKVVFDNNGSPYTVTTGSVIAITPASVNFYGSIQTATKQPATDTLVYLTIPGGIPTSTVLNDSSNYAFTLSTIRTSDGKSFVEFDPSATIANLIVESGSLQSNVNVTLTNSTPVPPITLGQNQDFLTVADTPDIAVVDPVANIKPGDSLHQAETPSIFNVEPLTDINAVSTTILRITNPKEEGETLNTLRPEFRGTAIAGNTISIAITGQKSISDVVRVASDNTWSWAPVIDLKTGKQKITISMVGSGGKAETAEKSFTISEPKTSLDPAFVSTPSASVKVSPSAQPSSTPRAAMPATDSGVPVTGVIENTLLTAGLGIVIMVIGAALLAF